MDFRHYQFCRDTGGDTLKVRETEEQIEILSYDSIFGRLVNFHILTTPIQKETPDDFLELAQQINSMKSDYLAELLQWGEDDNTLFYVTRMPDGPALSEFIRWQDDVTRLVLCELLRQFCRLIQVIAPEYHLLKGLELDDFRVVAVPGTEGNGFRLILSSYDFSSLSAAAEESEDNVPSSNQAQIDRLEASQTSEGSNEGQEVEQQLSALESLIADFLSEKGDRSVYTALDCYQVIRALLESDFVGQEAVIEGFAQELEREIRFVHEAERLGSSSAAAGGADLFAMPQGVVPRVFLGKELRLDENALVRARSNMQLFPSEEEDDENFRPHPYSIGAIDEEGQSLRLQVLPPERILPAIARQPIEQVLKRLEEEAVQDCLLGIAGFEEEGTAPVLIEERVKGFSLAEYLAKRGRIEPSEAHRILSEVAVGVDLMAGSKFVFSRLGTEDIFFEFTGAGEISPVRKQSLLSTPVDDLPPFRMKLRAHPSIDSLMNGWTLLPRVEASAAQGSTLNKARFSTNWAAQLFSTLLFPMLGLPVTISAQELADAKLPRKLESLLLEHLPGKFHVGPALPPNRFLARLKEAFEGAGQGVASSAALHSLARPQDAKAGDSLSDGESEENSEGRRHRQQLASMVAAEEQVTSPGVAADNQSSSAPLIQELETEQKVEVPWKTDLIAEEDEHEEELSDDVEQFARETQEDRQVQLESGGSARSISQFLPLLMVLLLSAFLAYILWNRWNTGAAESDYRQAVQQREGQDSVDAYSPPVSVDVADPSGEGEATVLDLQEIPEHRAELIEKSKASIEIEEAGERSADPDYEIPLTSQNEELALPKLSEGSSLNPAKELDARKAIEEAMQKEIGIDLELSPEGILEKAAGQ